MAYATLAHVELRNPVRGAYTASSRPTADAVVTFLHEAAGMVDQVLTSAGYALPVATDAASSALLVLQNANAVGAWYMAEWAAPASDKREESEDMWQTALKMLGRTELVLARDDAQSNPRSGFSCATAFFTRDMTL